MADRAGAPRFAVLVYSHLLRAPAFADALICRWSQILGQLDICSPRVGEKGDFDLRVWNLSRR